MGRQPSKTEKVDREGRHRRERDGNRKREEGEGSGEGQRSVGGARLGSKGGMRFSFGTTSKRGCFLAPRREAASNGIRAAAPARPRCC